MNVIRKYAILVSKYPSIEQPNAFGFVHSRVRTYLQQGLNIDVYRIDKKEYSYKFENVTVRCGNADYIRKNFDNVNYDVILIHFLDKEKIDIVGDRKCIIWVHGFEALSWKRRLYNLNPRLPLYIVENTKQLKNFKKYAQSHPSSHFVFVSKWMYNVTCSDIKYNIENYSIIPNIIDSSIFSFEQKSEEDVKKLLLIRSFANKKYANDISIKFIKELSKKPYFNQLTITLYGQGKFFNRLTKKIRKFSNISIYNHFLTQSQIAEIQKKHGVFLCPTRQDAQGVSMCEAMSSGLVPLTSYNTAIPEFVTDNKEGLLCSNKNIMSFVERYETLYYQPQIFLNMSEAASKRVMKQCSKKETIFKEIMLMENI